MIRWGIALLLLALFLGLFFGYGGAAGDIAQVGKWLILAGVIVAVIWALFGGLGSRGVGPPGPPI